MILLQLIDLVKRATQTLPLVDQITAEDSRQSRQGLLQGFLGASVTLEGSLSLTESSATLRVPRMLIDLDTHQT